MLWRKRCRCTWCVRRIEERRHVPYVVALCVLLGLILFALFVVGLCYGAPDGPLF